MEDYPFLLGDERDQLLLNRIYLPHKLWKELTKKNSKFSCRFIIELNTKDKIYLGHPFPAGDIRDNFVKIYGCISIPTPSNKDIELDRCRVSRYWDRNSILQAKNVTLSGPKLEAWNLNGMILINDGTYLGLKVVHSDPPCTDLPIVINSNTLLEFRSTPEEVTFSKDVGSSFQHNLAYNSLHEIVSARLKSKKVPIPMGILLSGPPGVGKTFAVGQVCRDLQVEYIVVNGPELLSSILGESESNLTKVFQSASHLASMSSNGITVLFIDEIDSIAVKRDEDSKQADIRILSHLLTLMDGSFHQRDSGVIIIGATNRPNSLDPAIRRPGRFDREVIINPPDQNERYLILRELLVNVQDRIDLAELAKRTTGYVPADLTALAREILLRNEDDNFSVTRALEIIRPSITRQYQVNVDPNITWDDIGGISKIKSQIQQYIEWPLKYIESFNRMGLRAPRGVLLYGPPGCSKTTIAKVLANSGSFSFYSISGAAIYSSYVGEAERILRDLFSNARLSSPSLIFIDELDAIVGMRKVGGVGDPVQERVLSTLLNEMDGIEELRQVVILGATNRMESIDAALLRPGRFDQLINVPLPDESDRLEILQKLARKTPFSNEFDLFQLAKMTDGYSGADLNQIIQEAALMAIHLGQTTITKECLTTKLSQNC